MKGLLGLMLEMARAKNLSKNKAVALQIVTLNHLGYLDLYGNQRHPTLFFSE